MSSSQKSEDDSFAAPSTVTFGAESGGYETASSGMSVAPGGVTSGATGKAVRGTASGATAAVATSPQNLAGGGTASGATVAKVELIEVSSDSGIEQVPTTVTKKTRSKDRSSTPTERALVPAHYDAARRAAPPRSWPVPPGSPLFPRSSSLPPISSFALTGSPFSAVPQVVRPHDDHGT